MEFLIKIAEWIIALVRQRNGVLEKELAQVAERYKALQKDKASLEDLFWKTNRLVVEKQIAINELKKRMNGLNDEFDDAIEKGVIDLKFIKDSVSAMEEYEVFKQLGGENEAKT